MATGSSWLWLGSFPATGVQHFRFDWIGELAGFNPLILEKVAETWNTPDDDWFSNGVVAWSGLTRMRLKGVDIKDADVTTLTRRDPVLIKLARERFADLPKLKAEIERMRRDVGEQTRRHLSSLRIMGISRPLLSLRMISSRW